MASELSCTVYFKEGSKEKTYKGYERLDISWGFLHFRYKDRTVGVSTDELKGYVAKGGQNE